MSEEFLKLVQSLDIGDTKDEENGLLDILIYYYEHAEEMEKSELLVIFAEMSKWRDITLTDGSDEYYYRIDYKPDAEILMILKKYASEELYNLYLEGFSGGEEVYEKIDNWLIERPRKLNDWLRKMIRKYVEEDK